ncbi:MAG: ABC transporter permease [Dehalococcoidia bacterium]|nr:ABC transporter permease [Dehalococcoidia bacterium]
MRRIRPFLTLNPTLPIVILVVLALAATVGPSLTPGESEQSDLSLALLPPAWQEGGDWSYPLGTDSSGRDILSRIMDGAKVTAIVAGGAIVVAAIIGVVLGVLAGFLGGAVDAVVMWAVDTLYALPTLILVIVAVTVIGHSLFALMLIMGLLGWAGHARVIRGQVLALRNREFVTLARIGGASNLRIMRRHILPNVAGSILVLTTLNVGSFILLESALSFLGLGVRPPNASWGVMLADGRNYISTAWWIVTFPGIAIGLTILCGNLLGDWLRDHLDPTLQAR